EMFGKNRFNPSKVFHRKRLVRHTKFSATHFTNITHRKPVPSFPSAGPKKGDCLSRQSPRQVMVYLKINPGLT
ncbi:MAG TPA: hypothetical protein VEC37_02245, partial [Bacillota bacterium]|nr:hypothetical protein [Bacillota bacterium]